MFSYAHGVILGTAVSSPQYKNTHVSLTRYSKLSLNVCVMAVEVVVEVGVLMVA